MPGWTLTQPWLSNEGMSNRGVLCIRYYCGDGLGYYGCKAHTVYRKALCSMVLVNEDESVADVDVDGCEGSGVSTPALVPSLKVSRRISSTGQGIAFKDAEGYGIPVDEGKKSTYTKNAHNLSFLDPPDLLAGAAEALGKITDSASTMSKIRPGEKYITDNPCK